MTFTDPKAKAIEVLRSGIANTTALESQVLDLYRRLTRRQDPVIDPLELQSSHPELYHTINRYEENRKAKNMRVTKVAWGEGWKCELFGSDIELGRSKTEQIKRLADKCGDLNTVRLYLTQEIAKRKVPNQGRSKDHELGDTLASVSRAEIKSATTSYLADKAAMEQEASFDVQKLISSK